VTDLAVTADGSLLVSWGREGSAVVWSLAGLDKNMQMPQKTLRAEELDRCWEDLASEDAGKAYRAIWGLARSPGQAAAALVRQRLAVGASGVDAAQLARLLADLNHKSFKRRERASEELPKLGSAAEAAVRAELRKGPASAEARIRLERILGEIEQGEGSLKALRCLRAVEVLEQSGTDEARQVLAVLARGSAVRLAQDAKAAHARLTQRLRR
jgi:hypothetical protein